MIAEGRSEEHTSELQSHVNLVCRLLLEKKKSTGELVTREELRSKLWPVDTFVDFDHSLNAAIKRLRDSLGESAEAPVFIETLPRRGYRFVAHVEKDSEPPATSNVGKPLFQRIQQKKTWIACGLITLFLLFGIAIWRLSRRTTEQPMISGEVALLSA